VLAQPPHLAQDPDEDLLDLGELGVWDLTSAFAKLLEEIGQQGAMEIEVERRDVGFYTERLLGQLKRHRELRFAEAFDVREGRYGLIGTLIALLEMIKQGYLRAHQERCFDDIQLVYCGGPEVTADQILAGIAADEQRQLAAQAVAADEHAGEHAGEGASDVSDDPAGDVDHEQQA